MPKGTSFVHFGDLPIAFLRCSGHSNSEFYYGDSKGHAWKWTNGHGLYARVCGYMFWDFMFQCADVERTILLHRDNNTEDTAQYPSGVESVIVASEPGCVYCATVALPGNGGSVGPMRIF